MIDAAYLPLGPVPPTELTRSSLGGIRSSLNDRRAGAAAATSASGIRVTDRLLALAGRSVAVRVYDGTTRDPDALVPTMIYCHSGAYVLGNLDTDHRRCLDLARAAQGVLVAVDYRLAPEHPYPAGLDDCFDVLELVADRPEELGIRRGSLAVGGSSAGAGLAAALALRVRDERDPRELVCQILHQPMLDPRCDTASMSRFDSTPYFDAVSARAAWNMYAGEAPREPMAYLAAAGVADLRGLPPTYVSISEVDPLRDEALHYVLRLLDAGVQTEFHHFPQTCHGFDAIAPNHPVAKAAVREQAEAWRSASAGARSATSGMDARD
jgi:acetyl esterase/lipase